MLFNWSLEEVFSFSRNWDVNERSVNFLHPHEMIWPEDPEKASYLCTEILKLLRPETHDLFYMSCVASALLAKTRMKSFWVWLKGRLTPNYIGLPFKDWDQMLGWHWDRILIPLTDGSWKLGCMLLVLVGSGKGRDLPLLPAWSSQALAKDTIKAVQDAAFALNAHGGSCQVFVWPIMDLGSGNMIYGDSIGLPVFLALYSVNKKQTINKEISATGRIFSASNRVGKITSLEKKISLCMRNGIKALIIPEANSLTLGKDITLEVLPASDTETAISFLEHFSPGLGLYMVQSLFGTNREEKVRACMNLPRGFLIWLKSRSDFSNIFKEEITKGRMPEAVVRSIEEVLAQPDCDYEKVSLILEGITPNFLKDISEKRPDIAYRLAQIGLIISNHKGEPDRSDEWGSYMKLLLPKIECFETSSTDLLNYYNLKIVGNHNRYCFDHDIEKTFDTQLKDTLDELRRVYQDRKEKIPNAVCTDLGAFYGTLSQNFGFCGPTYLERFEYFLQAALEAFGNGHVPGAPLENWRRDISYRVYAYLDAGLIEDAKAALHQYLGVHFEEDSVLKSNNPYEHAALIRYLADSRTQSRYLDWSERVIPKIKDRHPWQLWLHNLGRAALDKGKRSVAGSVWLKSLRLCLQSKGPTVKVMALLPLCSLYENRMVERGLCEELVNEILCTIESGGLSKTHFKDLIKARSWNSVIEITIEKVGSIFPFTYR